MTDIRSPICVLAGHVDHGKTSILDTIRGTAIQSGEAGGITQAIGASIIPLEIIQKICGPLLDKLKLDFNIPGLLFIDTPGHEAFTNLRKRGGNLADIAILVVDINEGFKPQTHETIKILQQYKTPFIIAANKIDLVSGWQQKEGPLLKRINDQHDQVKERLDNGLYTIVGELSKYDFNSERFDRVDDFTKEIAIVPCSAKTCEGMAELLMVLVGLAQKFLNECLTCVVQGPAKGTILEVKEEQGLGTTIDAIIYDGTLDVDDTIVIGGLVKPITTKVRSLLQPLPLAEMRDKKTKFKRIEKAHAATGVKIVAPGLNEVIAGMPIREASTADLEEIQDEVNKEIQDVLIEVDIHGIIVKADTIGSLEALTNLLKKEEILIRKGTVGTISKKDVDDAHANMERDKLQGAILGFNVEVNQEAEALAKELNIQIITNEIIYKLIEDYQKWHASAMKSQEAKELDGVVRPCKIEIMRGYVMRQSNPAIVGVDVLAGTLATNTPLMKNKKVLTTVKSIQHEKENLQKVEAGKQVAVSLPGVMVGRQINEGDVLYSAISPEDFQKMKKLKQHLSPKEIEILKEIANMMREDNPVWGI